jgi:hypothetical protein
VGMDTSNLNRILLGISPLEFIVGFTLTLLSYVFW